MPDICIIPNCISNSSGNKADVRFFTFPTDEKRLKKWLKFIPRKNFTITKNTNVCIKHFEERFFIKDLKFMEKDGKEEIMENENLRLKPNAVPTIFPSQTNLKRPKTANIKEEQHIEHKKRKIKDKKKCYCCGYTDNLYRLYCAPKSPTMRRKWMKVIPNSNPSMFTAKFRLCAKHFEKKLFGSNKYLLRSAIPTIFQFGDDSRHKMKDYDTTASSSTVTKFDSNTTLSDSLQSPRNSSRPSARQTSRNSSRQYLKNSEDASDWQGLAFEQILISSTPKNCSNGLISKSGKNQIQKRSPKITNKKIIQASKPKPRLRNADDVNPSKDYSPEESIQAIESVKAELAKVKSNSNIIQKKVDILKMKISAYQKFIATLVAKDRISKESAKLMQVLPGDIRRKEQIDLRKKLKNGDYSNALATGHDHDYL